MSADRWTACPRCARLRAQDIEKRDAELKAVYGEVSVDEFDRMRAELGARQNAPVKDTFREDYEIGVFGDEFIVSYTGSCGVCGLRHEFRHVETPTIGETS